MDNVMQNIKQGVSHTEKVLRSELIILHDMINDAEECILL
jgi:hypothetical protein